jgi:hypothetical protein
MKVTHILKRQEKPSRGPPSLWVARGANPQSKGSGECTSVASTQGALDIHVIQKPISNPQLPRGSLKNTIILNMYNEVPLLTFLFAVTY